MKSLIVAIATASLVVGLPTSVPKNALQPVQRQKKQ